MKVSLITVLTLYFVSNSTCSDLTGQEEVKPTNFDDLNPYLWSLIGSFQGNPYKNIPLVNKSTREFSSQIPLNRFLAQNFDIKEVSDCIECEDELKFVLDQICYGNPKDLMFLALTIDMFNKKLFTKTEKPLALYLARIFQNFKTIENVVERRITRYQTDLNKTLVRYQECDYLLEEMESSIENFLHQLLYLSRSAESNLVLNFLVRETNHFDRFKVEFGKIAKFYQRILLELGLRNGDTEEFFRTVMEKRGPDFMIGALISLATSPETPESRESALKRIDELLTMFQSSEPLKYSSYKDVFDYIKVLSKIHHGPDDPDFYNNEIQSKIVSDYHFYSLAEEAFKVGKLALADEILDRTAPAIQNMVIENLQNKRECDEHSSTQFYFHTFNSMSNPEKVICFMTTEMFRVAMYHYELSGFDVNHKIYTVTITLKARASEIHKGYPEYVRVTLIWPDQIDWYTMMEHLRISDETVFETILRSYLRRCTTNIAKSRQISYDAIKMILKSANLLQLVQNSGIRFELGYESLIQILKDSKLNISELKSIVSGFSYNAIECVLPKLTTGAELSRMELLTGNSIADLYLRYTHATDDAHVAYFNARQLFNYWLRSPHRDRIAEIDLLELKELIAKEHPLHRALIMAAIATEQFFDPNEHDEL